MDPQKICVMFKALSDETRVRIILELMDGEKCACMLLKHLRVTQPTLSYHMQVLCASGLVESQRMGKWTHYALSLSGTAEAQKITQQLMRATQRDPFCGGSCC